LNSQNPVFANFDVLILCLQKFAAEKGDQGSLVDSMNTQYFYYTRTKGLFRICYPKERPPTGECRNLFFVLLSVFRPKSTVKDNHLEACPAAAGIDHGGLVLSSALIKLVQSCRRQAIDSGATAPCKHTMRKECFFVGRFVNQLRALRPKVE
jgi:hypothetical protein